MLGQRPKATRNDNTFPYTTLCRSDDGQKHTFNLNKGVKFHNKAPVNGREFTAEDVLKTVEMYSAGSQKDVFSMVESIETPDDYTVVFNLDRKSTRLNSSH